MNIDFQISFPEISFYALSGVSIQHSTEKD